jgi:hypothetical protein
VLTHCVGMVCEMMGNNSVCFRIKGLPRKGFQLCLAFHFHFSFICGRKVTLLYHLARCYRRPDGHRLGLFCIYNIFFSHKKHLASFQQFPSVNVFVFFDSQLHMRMAGSESYCTDLKGTHSSRPFKCPHNVLITNSDIEN